MFFGFAFGTGGIGGGAGGVVADVWGIEFAFRLCALLPAIGLLIAFLPELDQRKEAVA
jgi:FSR family fosmidomycin resistance protein-like MFS transporter